MCRRSCRLPAAAFSCGLEFKETSASKQANHSQFCAFILNHIRFIVISRAQQLNLNFAFAFWQLCFAAELFLCLSCLCVWCARVSLCGLVSQQKREKAKTNLLQYQSLLHLWFCVVYIYRICRILSHTHKWFRPDWVWFTTNFSVSSLTSRLCDKSLNYCCLFSTVPSYSASFV